jgi:acetylglutamate kinase
VVRLVVEPFAGELRVMTGTIVSTKNVLAPLVLVLLAPSAHRTNQAWLPLAMPLTASTVAVPLDTDELVLLSTPSR